MVTIFRNARLLTMDPALGSLGEVPDGVVVVRDGRIDRVGPRTEVLGDSVLGGSEDVGSGDTGRDDAGSGVGGPGESESGPEHGDWEVVDCAGGWLSPGLVDCHTHLVFGGSRADEFRRRLEGESYADIARGGGGILSTVRSTREASDEELVESGALRATALARSGVTTLEIKSGYGLDVDTELRMLRAARRIGERTGLRVRTTLLGAHALPPEFAGDRSGFLRTVIDELIPLAVDEGLATGVDAFLESIAFDAEECRAVLQAGRDRGLAVRLHADQLSDGGGGALAAELGARSADHVEYTSLEGVGAMAKAGTAAVLLPGAFHYLGESRVPPVAAFRQEGVPIAVATDANPGSSPVLSMPEAMSLACIHFGLTVEEVWLGATRIAADVLGLEGEAGVLVPGARADLALWDMEGPTDLVYWRGNAPLQGLWSGGRRLRL